MTLTPLSQLLEAALFAANRPLTVEELAALEVDATLADVRTALDQLREHYDFDGHAVELQELAGGWQLLTRPAFAAAIERAQVVQRSNKLSAATLETLAIIAYRQPVGRHEIEEIRGVSAGGVLRALQERGLIEVVGRSEALGRPLLYGTTAKFLELLGMRDVSDLPRADELTIALHPVKLDVPVAGEAKPAETAAPASPEAAEPSVAAADVAPGAADVDTGAAAADAPADVVAETPADPATDDDVPADATPKAASPVDAATEA